MIQTGAQMALERPSTPPSSPTQLSSEELVTLNSVYQFINIVKAIVAMEIASTLKCTCSDTPSQPSTQVLTSQDLEELILKLICKIPTNQPLAQIVTTEHILNILKSLSTKEGPFTSPDLIRASEGIKPDALEDSKPQIAPSSKLEFKIANKVYVYNNYKLNSANHL